MILRDLTDAAGWIKRIIYRLDRLEGGAPLENASVTNGLLRFIGGTLRVDSGGRVEIVGTLQIAGTTTVTGRFELSGDFEVSGPWKFTGPGEITGDFDIAGDVMITGKVTQVGDMDVDGKFTLRGDGWSITGSGEITGDVSLKGTISVDGGRIEVGDMVISEASGGSLAAPIQIVINTPLLDLVGGLNVAQGAVLRGNMTTPNLPTISETASGLPRNSAYINPATGQWYRVVA